MRCCARGLEQLVSGAADMEVVGTAADGARRPRAGRRTAAGRRADGPADAGVDGVTATRTILAETTGAEVLVLTSFSDGERIVAALDAGAVGYLLKDAEPEDVSTGSGR